MSDTIQTRQYSPKQSTLLQRRPSTLIDAAESFHRTYVQGSYVIDTAVIIGTGGLGSAISKSIAGTRLLLVDVDLATSAGDVTAALDDYNSDTWLRWTKTTKAVLQQVSAESTAAPSATAKLRVDRLTAVQAIFGLPMLELAEMLHVTRQALYKWLDASKDVKLQEASRDRLALVERIGERWRERSAAPLRAVAHEPLANGQTVLQMMAAEVVDEAAVVGALDELVEKLQGKPKSRSQKLAEAGFTRRPSPRSLPSDD